MTTTKAKFALLGTIIHSLKFGEIELIEKGLLVYNGNGIIDKVLDLSKLPPDHIKSISSEFESIVDYKDKFIIPGFVDAHCHAPQYVFAGTGMDLPLLQWLETYTFPCESKFSDSNFAKAAYARSVRRHLRSGTTFASYFATIHRSASEVLAEVIANAGQRAFVGKVNMDRNSPDYYIEDTLEGIHDTELFIKKVLAMTPRGCEHLLACNGSPPVASVLMDKVDTPLVLPCITPRFVPTCSGPLMAQLGVLAKKYGLPVQSHLSESLNEIEWVRQLHPDCPTYAHVYAKYDLLQPPSFMAHCCHSNKEERALMREHGVGAVHCASSNFMIASGVMDVRQFVDEGVKVAVGTDVAGGYSSSMLDALRQTLIASRVKEIASSGSDVKYKGLTYAEAFHLITVGGAEVLGMGSVVGNFLPGKKLDCLVVDPHVEGGPFDVFEGENSLAAFQKFLFLGDDRNIGHIYVDGKKVV